MTRLNAASYCQNDLTNPGNNHERSLRRPPAATDGPRHSWPEPDRTPGRYCLLEHPVGQPVGVLLAGDDGGTITFVSFSGSTAAGFGSQVIMGIQAAYSTGTSWPGEVFNHRASLATKSVNATAHGHTNDMGAIIEHVNTHDRLPPQ